jgi:hypothetical protein
MNILTTLPADTFVTSAFAELLEDVTNLLSASEAQKPLDKADIGFWRRQLNALNKAESYWAQGVRPDLSVSSYLLASASRPGALIHRLSKVGGIVVCSCEAGQKQQLCWHHMLVNVLERAAELEMLAEDEAEISGNDDDEEDVDIQYDNVPYPYGIGNPDAPADDEEAVVSGDPQTSPNPIPHAAQAAAWVAGQITLSQRLAATAQLLDTLRAAQQRPPETPHISVQARAAYTRANQPAHRRPLFADRDAETFRRQALAEERAVLLEQRARRAA